MMGPLFAETNAGEILGAMITPAVLISASGTLTLTTTNRLGRIVDRIRILHGQADELPPSEIEGPESAEKRAQIADQVTRQSVRIGVLQIALISLYVAIGFLVGSSVAIGLSSVASEWLGWVPVGLGLGGAVALLVGAVLLIREAQLAVRSTYAEMGYIQRMVAQRTGAPPPLYHHAYDQASPAANATPKGPAEGVWQQ